jgi:hypothetical protein
LPDLPDRSDQGVQSSLTDQVGQRGDGPTVDRDVCGR